MSPAGSIARTLSTDSPAPQVPRAESCSPPIW